MTKIVISCDNCNVSKSDKDEWYNVYWINDNRFIAEQSVDGGNFYYIPKTTGERDTKKDFCSITCLEQYLRSPQHLGDKND